jgi:hypothetical protein
LSIGYRPSKLWAIGADASPRTQCHLEQFLINLDTKFDGLKMAMDGVGTKIDSIDAKIDVKFDELDTKIDVKFNELDCKIDTLVTNLDRAEDWYTLHIFLNV